MENAYNEYPLIVYKDITYFPMAYEYARFMGLKANWYKNKKVLFIGVSENPSIELMIYSRNTPNKKKNKALVVNYDIAINTTNPHNFLDNGLEEYPFLNFRGVTYMPLTWKFAVEEFGWKYSWDSENGLIIDSSDPFRPIIDDRRIGATLPQVFGKDYFYGDDYYVGYPYITMNNQYDIIVRKRGEEEKVYNLKEQLSDGDYFFNQMVDANGGIPADPTSPIKPVIEGNIFSIVCYRNSTNGRENVLLKIDLDNGTIINKEIID